MTSSRLGPPRATSAHASSSHASSSGPAEERPAGRIQLGRQRRGRTAGASGRPASGPGAAPAAPARAAPRRDPRRSPRPARPDPTQRGQRVGLPAAPVQRRHQVHPELLMQRMRGAQRLRLGDHVCVAARRQPRRQPDLQTGQPDLGQPLRLRREPAAVGELAVRLAPPQRERAQPDAARPPAACRRPGPGGPGGPGPRTRTRRRHPPVNASR